MYWTHQSRFIIGLLLAALLPRAAGAESAEEQYALAAGYYAQTRWVDAEREFRKFLDQHRHDRRADLATFFLGEALVQLGKYEPAYQVFGEFIERFRAHRFHRQALFRYGETAYLSGKDEPARRHLKQFYDTYPHDELCAYVLPYLGQLLLRSGDATQARQYYNDALNKFSQGPLADQCRFGMGQSLELLGKDLDAQRFYRHLSSNPQSELADDALLQEAMLYYHRQRYTDAASALRQFGERFSNSDLTAQALYWLGMSHMALGNWQAASPPLVEAGKSVSEENLAAAIAFAAGEALRKGGDTGTAKQHYRRVVDRWPASQWGDDSLQALVQLALEAEDHESVTALAAEMDQLYPSSPLREVVQLVVGRSLLKCEKFQPAIDLFEQLAHGSAAHEKLDASAVNYLLGLAYLGAQRPADALRALDQVQPLDGQTELAAGTHMARATAHVARKDYARAVEAQRQYLALLSNGADAAKCRAELTVSLTHLGKLHEALQAQRDLAACHADHPLTLPTTHFLAETAYAKQQHDIARQLFTELSHNANPQYVEKGLFGLAWLEAETGDPDKAAETFERLLQQYPRSAIAPQAAIMHAKLLEKRGRRDEALGAYARVYERFPAAKEAPAAMVAAAQLRASDGLVDSKNRAVEMLEHAIAEYPELPNVDAALYQLAWLLLDLSRSADAHAAFTRLHDEFPKSRYWADATYRLAAAGAEKKDLAQAIPLTDQLIQSATQGDILDHALYLRGQLAAEDGDWARVTDVMQQLLAKSQNESLRLPGQYWLAESLYRRGQYAEADEQFAGLAARIKDRQDSWMAMVPLRRAQILAQRKKWTEAFELSSTIAERFPDFRQQYEVDYLLGRCLASRGMFTEARQAYERVVRSPAGSRSETAAMAQWMIGESFFHQENYDEAIKAYHRVETLYAFPQWQSGALLQAGKCYELKGDWENVVKMYAQLLKQYPETASSKEASQRLHDAQQKMAAASAAGLR